MNINLIWKLAGVVLSIVCPFTAIALPLASSSQMTLEANSNFNFDFDPPNVSDIDTDLQGPTLNPLMVAVDARITDVSGVSSIRTHGQGSASWFDASSGVVSFPELGWEVQNAQQGLAYLIRQPIAPSWSYSFIPESDGLFVLSYAFSGTPAGFPPGGERFDFAIGSDSSILSINTSGLLSFPLQSGQHYDAELTLGYGITFTSSEPTTFSDAASAEFQLAIISVPEPSTGLLLGSALMALICVRLSRRSR